MLPLKFLFNEMILQQTKTFRNIINLHIKLLVGERYLLELLWNLFHMDSQWVKFCTIDLQLSLYLVYS